MKRILTIQDISCLGKCSLTVALPLLSALGHETVILPTAVLSTHTMFEGFTVKDLSDQLEPITKHWKDQGFKFDAIYTGYLGTEEEIETVKSIIKEFATDETLVFVDPAMADNGKLYPAFDLKYAKKNASLCGIADVIVPNITEASFMTGVEYKETYDENYVKTLLKALVDLGAKTAILTGVSLSEGKTGAMGLDSKTGEYFAYQNDRIPAAYHGTGDIFSSVVVGALLRGFSRYDSIKIAADYTAKTIDITRNNPEKPWYGVDFEATIPELVETVEKIK
ncbi:MAG: pyridoxamine kinase [Ruminococcaceae bacterium]|jgi:pyridoxine kinase|nr:pyridoxamine kinase [Oscillospiraceae bacterium]